MFIILNIGLQTVNVSFTRVNKSHDGNKACCEHTRTHQWLEDRNTHRYTISQRMNEWINEWVMMRWHTWSQTVRCSEKWMGWRGWRTGCKSAGATGRLTSSWSCSLSLCWRLEACHCKRNLHPQVSLHSHLGAFAWKYRRMLLDRKQL